MSSAPTTKTFGKSTRSVPTAAEKAQKWYPAEDVAQPRKVRKTIRPWTARSSLVPGTVLILLVTGPFKINGVPLRRVNSRYVIATSLKVDVTGISEETIEKISAAKYFTADKAQEKAGEEAFFKQGEKPEISSSRVADQKAIDKALLANIKKVEFLASYLASSFSLRKGDKPHEMVW
ncbi:ribosomal protein L6e-domain-containing protein [Podospora didyma]|uniref:60S ribosomal protein L6 n=1 Tax=Podospora didyma TaxID=330526 RepID=A0AAE0P799_9PEZI|nr:ribosomal protein L6e-domain-containing protein [Podospora didyma]